MEASEEMKRISLLAGLIVSVLAFQSSLGAASDYRITWTLSSFSLDSPNALYNKVRLDLEPTSRFIRANGALYSDEASDPVYPVVGTCLSIQNGNYKCGLQFERYTLEIIVNSTLNGDYTVLDYDGVPLRTGMVFNLGIL